MWVGREVLRGNHVWTRRAVELSLGFGIRSSEKNRWGPDSLREGFWKIRGSANMI